jgi:excisionase family DNA binding protein
VPDDDILSVAQVAAEFAVTEQTVRSWLASGKLKGGRVGKAYRILRRDVFAMLEVAAATRRESDRDFWDRPQSELDEASPAASSGDSELWLSGDAALVPLAGEDS